jgi:DNA-binding MarR family transcriptional regulator
MRARGDPTDRRRHLVEITGAGVTALEQAELAQASIEDEVLAALSSEERATLRALLARALESVPSQLAQPDLAAAS